MTKLRTGFKRLSAAEALAREALVEAEQMDDPVLLVRPLFGGLALLLGPKTSGLFYPGVQRASVPQRRSEHLLELTATPGAAGGYRLEAGAAMPPLLLDDDEAVAVAVGLRTAANGTIAGIEEISVRALAKLEQVLPSRRRRRVAALGESTVSLAARGPCRIPGRRRAPVATPRGGLGVPPHRTERCA